MGSIRPRTAARVSEKLRLWVKGVVKYFFLSDGWDVSRMWEQGGQWHGQGHRRKLHLQCLYLGVQEQQEVLWLHEVEDDVLMVEVKPGESLLATNSTLGRVILKRLMDAETAIARLANSQTLIRQDPPTQNPPSHP